MAVVKCCLLFLFVVYATGCIAPFIYKDDIMKPGKETLYRIASQPTDAANRKDAVQYKHGFEVLGVIDLSATQSDSLKQALINTNNYDAANTKRCIFTPAYLLQQDSSFSVLLAASPCGKAMFAKNGKDSMIDLANKNGVEELLKRIDGGK